VKGGRRERETGREKEGMGGERKEGRERGKETKGEAEEGEAEGKEAGLGVGLRVQRLPCSEVLQRR
jgi:hypothetical protein